MKRLDRYLIREMIVPFLIGQGAVVLMLTGTVLYNNADVFLQAHVPAVGIVKVAAYFIPYLVGLTMPVAMAIAASLLISRLARDTEITVMRAAGISLKRIFLSIFAFGVALSIADFYFAEKIVPWSNQQYERTVTELSRTSRVFVPQSQQVVVSKDRRLYAYIDNVQLQPSSNRATLYNVMIYQRELGQNLPRQIIADSAEYDDGWWTMRNARIHEYMEGGLREKFSIAPTLRVNFRLSEQTFMGMPLQLPLYSSAATKTWADLGAELRSRGLQAAEFKRRTGGLMKDDQYTLLTQLEFHFKLSVPFSCLVFAIVCPPLALRFARAGNFMGVLLSICLVFVYWNTLLAAKIIGSRYPDVLPPVVAAWGQNVVFTLVGLFFLWRGE